MLACHQCWAEATPNNRHICQIMRFREIFQILRNLGLARFYNSDTPSHLLLGHLFWIWIHKECPQTACVQSETRGACFLSRVWVFWVGVEVDNLQISFMLASSSNPALWIGPALTFWYLLEMDTAMISTKHSMLLKVVTWPKLLMGRNWGVVGNVMRCHYSFRSYIQTPLTNYWQQICKGLNQARQKSLRFWKNSQRRIFFAIWRKTKRW